LSLQRRPTGIGRYRLQYRRYPIPPDTAGIGPIPMPSTGIGLSLLSTADRVTSVFRSCYFLPVEATATHLQLPGHGHGLCEQQTGRLQQLVGESCWLDHIEGLRTAERHCVVDHWNPKIHQITPVLCCLQWLPIPHQINKVQDCHDGEQMSSQSGTTVYGWVLSTSCCWHHTASSSAVGWMFHRQRQASAVCAVTCNSLLTDVCLSSVNTVCCWPSHVNDAFWACRIDCWMTCNCVTAMHLSICKAGALCKCLYYNYYYYPYYYYYWHDLCSWFGCVIKFSSTAF